MTTSRMLIVAVMLFALLKVEEACADANAAVAPTGMVLTSGELDSSRVAVGMWVEVVYGKGARHRFSGEWAELVTVRGVIEAVDWDRRQVVVAREGDGRTETVVMDRIQAMRLIDLMVKKMSAPHRWPHLPLDDIENGGLRVLAKLGTGTVSATFLTAIGYVGLGYTLSDGSYSDDGLEGVGFLLFGAVIGCSVGFPLGVSAVDPYDSWPKTLLTGVIPGLVGIGLIRAGNETGFAVTYVGPVISSLIASELSRKPPQDRRISFVLSPTLNGGLSAVTTLRF